MSGLSTHSTSHGAGAEHISGGRWTDPLNDGTRVLIRPLEPRDRDREFTFIKQLSPQTRRFRFLATFNEPSQSMMNQLMDIDYRQRMAYVALVMVDHKLAEIGIARYAAAAGDQTCEAAVVVADDWQRKGLGKQLMEHLIEAAKANGFHDMISIDTAANSHMRSLAGKLGFECESDPLDATQVVYRLNLQ